MSHAAQVWTAQSPARVSGSTTVGFNNIGRLSYFALVPVVSVASGNTGVFVADPTSLATLSNGVVSYSFNNGALVGTVNASGSLTLPGALAVTALTTLNSNFFQDWQPFERQSFITAAQGVAANTLSGGPWVRGKYGNENDSVTATAGPVIAHTRTATEFSGFQVGGDIGVFNINKTGWNFVTGVTGGEFFASSIQKRGGSIKGNLEVPYIGGYAAVTNGPFFFDVLYHHDFLGLQLNDPTTGLANKQLVGEANSVHVESAYTVALGNYGEYGSLFVTPQGSVIVSKLNLNPLQFTQLGLGTVRFNDVDSVLGKAGLRFGSNILTEKFAFQPFIEANVWNEFEGNATSTFDASSGLIVPLSVSRVGTFGQFGVGLNGELLGKNILGTLRADFRAGNRTNGESVTAQVRYQF